MNTQQTSLHDDDLDTPKMKNGCHYFCSYLLDEFLINEHFIPGHCGKTVAIIRRFHALSETTPLKWLVVADDDTLLRWVFTVS